MPVYKITGKSGKSYTIDKDEFENNMDDIINGNPDAEIDVENDESYGSVALRDYKDAMAEGWRLAESEDDDKAEAATDKTNTTAQPAAQKPMTQAEYGKMSPVAQDVANGVGVKPEERRTYFVPEADNLVYGTPSKEAQEKYPWLKADELSVWNKDTGKPVYQYVDGNGLPMEPKDAAMQNAKAEIASDDSLGPRKEAAALQLPGSTVSGIKTVRGSLDKRADEYLSKEYGKGYADKTYKDKDGNGMTGAELRDQYKQGLYDNLRESLKAAHIALASGSVDPGKVREQMQAQWGDVVGEESLERYLLDEQATKRDLHDYAEEKLEKAYAERNLIREQMDERGKEMDAKSSPFVDQWSDNPRERDGKYMELRMNLDAVENRIKSWEAVRDADDIGVARGLKNTLFDPKTWDFGKSDFEHGLVALTSRGEGRDRLAARIGEEEEAASFEDKNTSNLYRYTKIAGISAPYFADFVMGGGLINAISKGTAKTVVSMLNSLGVDPESIMYDNFG